MTIACRVSWALLTLFFQDSVLVIRSGSLSCQVINSVTLGKTLNLFWPLFPHLLIGGYEGRRTLRSSPVLVLWPRCEGRGRDWKPRSTVLRTKNGTLFQQLHWACAKTFTSDTFQPLPSFSSFFSFFLTGSQP